MKCDLFDPTTSEEEERPGGGVEARHDKPPDTGVRSMYGPSIRHPLFDTTSEEEEVL